MSARTCSNCGEPLPPDARFCPRCGTPVGAEVEPVAAWPDLSDVSAEVTERKVVSVLFADLARSTELASTLDPERFREVITAFYRMVSRELASLRGRAEKFAGDAVMAVWGLPHAHEDDALRAIRAGLIIRDRTAKLGDTLDLPVPLEVRVGVNSGPVATGPGPGDQVLVSGAAVNLAARLQQAAEPGEILAGDTTWQLTRFAVEFGPARTIDAKGFADSVTAWPVVALSMRSSRRTIPLVGRERELGFLRDTFERARRISRAHLVSVLGEPGIGKSRLVDEFVVGLPEDAHVLAGRASEFAEDVTFAPLVEMIRREIGVERDAPRSELRLRLREVVDSCCDPSDSERVAARLGQLVGLDVSEGDLEGVWAERMERFQAHLEGDGGESGRFRAAEIRAAFLTLLEGMSRSGPVVLVFEDLHLARPAMLDLIEQTLQGARRLPVLVVAVARDELLETRPGWGGGHPDALTIRLEQLGPEEAAELASVAGELDEDTAFRVATHAGGNPFFIIETTGMLLQEHPEHVFGTPHSHLLPPTVQAVVASRIDHLPDDARDLFRKASVFSGRSFSREDLQVVAEPRDEVLQVLEDSELLVRDQDRPDSWRFRHEVLAEVAYESVPKRERQRLHLEVAERIIEAGDEERYPHTLAYHLEQAARASLDLDPADRKLADRAVEALTRAGDRSRWRIESRTAIDLYERALALAGPADAWGAREARILSSIGECHYWLGEFEEAAAVLERALEVGGDDSWTEAHASRFLGDIELNVRAQPDRAEELFRRALDAAHEAKNPWAESRALIMGAWVPYWRGDNDAARAMFEEGLAIARSNPQGDRWAEARALTSLASVVSGIGDEAEALALAEEALALGRDMQDPFTTAVAQQYVGNSLRRMWRLEEALEPLDGAVRTFRDLGARWELGSTLSDRGNLHRLLGNAALAEKDLRESVGLCKQLGERNLITWTIERLVRVLVERGEFAEARRVLAEVETLLDPDDPGGRIALLTCEHLIALGEGDTDGARERALGLLDLHRASTARNDLAGVTWWVGGLFGPDAVGGEEALEEARRTLEAARWIQSTKEPDLFLAALERAPQPSS